MEAELYAFYACSPKCPGKVRQEPTPSARKPAAHALPHPTSTFVLARIPRLAPGDASHSCGADSLLQQHVCVFGGGLLQQHVCAFGGRGPPLAMKLSTEPPVILVLVGGYT